MKQDEITEFLRESNAIEGVYDGVSFDKAVNAWNYLISQREMSKGVVLKTHAILMSRSNLLPDEIGYFRQVKVWVGGREGAPSQIVPKLIQDWCNSMNMVKEPLENHSKILHVNFEKIHPFVDGNGRTGRMFMNWWRLKNGLPLLIIHEGKEQIDYYGWFKE